MCFQRKSPRTGSTKRHHVDLTNVATIDRGSLNDKEIPALRVALENRWIEKDLKEMIQEILDCLEKL